MNNRKKGKYAEQKAAEYLSNRGYKVICQNWTCRWGEIDIIAINEDALVFVEVKYRANKKFGDPEKAVTYKKINSLKRSIQKYFLETTQKHKIWRIDVISMQGQNILHYKSVDVV